MTDPAPYPDLDGTQACAGEPAPFFPTPLQAAAHHRTTGPTGANWHNTQSKTRDAWHQIQYAIDLCRACPLQRPCLAYALTHDVDGIWGATTALQRRDLREAHGITAVPVVLNDVDLRAIDVDRFDRGGGFRRRHLTPHRPDPTHHHPTPST